MTDPNSSAPAPAIVAPVEPPPVLVGLPSQAELTETLFGPVWRPPSKTWLRLLGLGMALSGLLVIAICVTIFVGVGTWGINIPVAWAFAITDFVWWIGIGHAGTLISAILLLFQQKWRTSINRMAEAMTLFAVMMAGLFPLLHLGRPWFFYWLLPYPATTGLWPQFKSPLTWDVFAVSTYFTISLVFWYVGLVPDLGALRDASTSRLKRFVYGLFSLGWRGSARHWHHYQTAYLLLAGLATPLVLSVHTIVSFDFAVSVMPGWHEDIFPPYFVGGAIFSGFAMVLVLVLPARRLYRLESVITVRHVEAMNKLILATSWMVFYGYATENFMAWYSGDRYAIYTYWFNQETGWPLAPLFWLLLLLNFVLPQLHWLERARRSTAVSVLVALGVLVGMWLERFVLILRAINRDFLPASWWSYGPTWVDWSLFAGTLGFFLTAFLLFLKFVPPIPVSEVRELRHHLAEERARAEGPRLKAEA
ncbi:MAG TPA: NrfD/PsrC family molybdoenzyme membrane anchor subunit [Myxococcales bacterium]|jgi:molybdopterin-containing oxidoreductase family membrane subunit